MSAMKLPHVPFGVIDSSPTCKRDPRNAGARRLQAPLIRTSWLAMALCLAGARASAQNLFEARGASTKYRYLDWSLTSPNSMILDVFYIGVPGSNEFNLGVGYGFKPTPFLVLAPLTYAVFGKESGQRGLKIALLVVYERAGWKANSFLAHYAPARGLVSRYQVLDTLDVTRVLRTRWEAGMSAGFFHGDGGWNPQVGSLLKRNDRLGAWGLSYRFGRQKELRLTRTVILKR